MHHPDGGDPHLAQGDGEVALTAMEAPLRGTFRLSVLRAGSQRIPGGRGRLDLPFGETAEYWLPVGLDADLHEAMKQAVRVSIPFLEGELGMSRSVAYAYLSAATDYVVPGRRSHEGRPRPVRKADFGR